MLFQFQEYLSFENIYLWINLGVLPFWIMLIIIPNSKFTRIFVNSIILPTILGSVYIYVTYQAIILEDPFLDIFRLYLNLDNLYTVFATESFLLIFWIHFISINLFLGSWVSRDSVNHNISRAMACIPLLLIYFIGPIGLVWYWLIRVFYAKKLGFHD